MRSCTLSAMALAAGDLYACRFHTRIVGDGDTGVEAAAFVAFNAALIRSGTGGRVSRVIQEHGRRNRAVMTSGAVRSGHGEMERPAGGAMAERTGTGVVGRSLLNGGTRTKGRIVAGQAVGREQCRGCAGMDAGGNKSKLILGEIVDSRHRGAGRTVQSASVALSAGLGQIGILSYSTR